MPYPWMNITFEKNPANIPETLRFPRIAAHALLYCACSDKKCLFGTVPMEYAIMMQLRHDGMIGFPGGYVNEQQESIEVGLNRELHEEIGLSSKEYFNRTDYVGAWIHSRDIDSLVDHFYVKEYKEKDFLKIEQAALSSQDWGTESRKAQKIEIEPVNDVLRRQRLRWWGHILRKDDEDWVKNCVFPITRRRVKSSSNLEVDGKRENAYRENDR